MYCKISKLKSGDSFRYLGQKCVLISNNRMQQWITAKYAIDNKSYSLEFGEDGESADDLPYDNVSGSRKYYKYDSMVTIPSY